MIAIAKDDITPKFTKLMGHRQLARYRFDSCGRYLIMTGVRTNSVALTQIADFGRSAIVTVFVAVLEDFPHRFKQRQDVML